MEETKTVMDVAENSGCEVVDLPPKSVDDEVVVNAGPAASVATVLVLGAGVAAIGVAAYLGIKKGIAWYKNKKAAKEFMNDVDVEVTPDYDDDEEDIDE